MSAKVSSAFRSRLERTLPAQRVRALVVLDVPKGDAASRPRGSHTRRTLLSEVQAAAAPWLAEIDAVLAASGGTRTSDDIGALGTVVIEASAKAIHALERNDHVKAILEDQRAFGISAGGRPGRRAVVRGS